MNDVISFIPVIMLLLSLGAALMIFPMPEHANRLRGMVNITLAVIKVGLVATLFPLVLVEGVHPEVTLPFVPGLELVLRVEPLSLLFAALSSVLWLVTTVYAIGYLEGRPNRSRFFGFFSLCVTATVGISFAGNLVTFLLFYEMLSLVTYPLVAHWGSPEALRAARTYLRYTLTGGLSLLVGVIWLTVYAGQADFQAGGAEGVDVLAAESPTIAILIFILVFYRWLLRTLRNREILKRPYSYVFPLESNQLKGVVRVRVDMPYGGEVRVEMREDRLGEKRTLVYEGVLQKGVGEFQCKLQDLTAGEYTMVLIFRDATVRKFVHVVD